MRHSTTFGAAFASLLLSTSTYAFDPILTPTADDGMAGVEWVRQTLESGFDGKEMRPAAWSDVAGPSAHVDGTMTLSAGAGTVHDSRGADLTARPTAAPVADGDSVEEVVVLGVRQRAPQWHPPIVEEPETDWHSRDGAVRTDTGRIAVGRAVIYQDLSARRRYDMFRDEYRDARPQQSVSVGLGRQRVQD